MAVIRWSILFLTALFCVPVACLANTPTSEITAVTPAPFGSGKVEGLKPNPFGECFTFHGRACIYNGGPPNLRIWMIGTHRVIGIEDDIMPEKLSKLLSGCKMDDEIYGDFTVCPVTKFVKGTMHHASIQDVHITAVKHNSAAPCP